LALVIDNRALPNIKIKHKKSNSLFAMQLLVGKYSSTLCWWHRTSEISFTVQFVPRFCLVCFVLRRL